MSATPDAMETQVTEAQKAATEASGALMDTTKDFNPPENNQPAFSMPEPQNHFNDIVGLSPMLMALGAVGGVLGRTHGIAMIQSTNAMMKGMVQGADDQYKDARQQYENKYAQWKDASRTWFDTYKAYMSAYKGRVDAQAKAVQGANAALGLAIKDQRMTAQQVEQTRKISAQIDELHHRSMKEDSDSVSNRIRSDSQAARVDIARKEAAIKLEEVNNKTKTADANALTATSRSLKAEADTILRQYPASGDKKMPDELKEKLNGIRDAMDLVQERLKQHSESNYNKNKDLYDSARAAIARGADAVSVKKRLAEQGLNPDML